jgi:hypothetical protein
LGKQQFLTQNYSLPQDTQFLAIDFADLVTYQLQYGNNNFYQFQYQRALNYWNKNLTDFGAIAINDSIVLYQKGAASQFNLVRTLANPPSSEIAADLSLNQEIKLLGYNKNNGQYQLFWRLDYLIPNYCLQLTLLNQKNKIVYQKIYPFAYGLLPPNENWHNQNIQTNYWFGFYGVDKGTYTAKINLLDITKGGLQLDADRSTVNIIDQKELIGPAIDLGQVII